MRINFQNYLKKCKLNCNSKINILSKNSAKVYETLNLKIYIRNFDKFTCDLKLFSLFKKKLHNFPKINAPESKKNHVSKNIIKKVKYRSQLFPLCENLKFKTQTLNNNFQKINYALEICFIQIKTLAFLSLL
ncbi:hypothetical protein BpHYR1_043902 [Brachionus plicatilis]|uniref:Uncharacterized protein n=1 Tax=Brachionus plicatilis TaxID=10195 RepID=A0A3M7SS46_BRAPC|nr:hypothetical protein BpHYR1_043902 [Brachionus plicatilis]